jgi:hypothetical protein
MMQHHTKAMASLQNAGHCRGYKERVLRNHRFRETAIVHNCSCLFGVPFEIAKPKKLFPDKSASNSATCEQSFSIVHSHYPQNCLHNAYAAATRTAQQPTPYAQRSLRRAANTQTTACQHENDWKCVWSLPAISFGIFKVVPLHLGNWVTACLVYPTRGRSMGCHLPSDMTSHSPWQKGPALTSSFSHSKNAISVDLIIKRRKKNGIEFNFIKYGFSNYSWAIYTT